MKLKLYYLSQDFIRAHANFEFKQIEFNISELDKDLLQSEIENEENIKFLNEICRQKFPDLRQKVGKYVRSVFKEKFRAWARVNSTGKSSSDYLNNENEKTSKVDTKISSNSKVFNSSPSYLANGSKLQETTKSKVNEYDTAYQVSNKSSNSSVSPTISQKHSLSTSNDSKPISSSKKLKSSSSSSSLNNFANGVTSSDDEKINTKVNENKKN